MSHSELRLRSVDPDSVRDVVEVTFYGVVGMRLKTVYRPLTLCVADAAQTEEMMTFADVPQKHLSRVRVLALKSAGADGLVACVGYSVWSHPRGGDVTEPGSRESVLILRG